MIGTNRLTTLLLFFLLAFGLVEISGAAPDAPLAQVSPEATITVNSLDDNLQVDGQCTLREAISAAALNAPWDGCIAGNAGSEHDVIVFAVDGTIELALGEFVISSPLTIKGNGRHKTIIDAGGNGRIITSQTASIRLEALTLQNGYANDPGGAIRAYHPPSGPRLDLDLNDVVIQDSTSNGKGGAISVIFWNLTIQNSLLQRNSAGEKGGAISTDAVGGILDIEDSVLRGNYVAAGGAGGGAIFFTGPIQITRTLIEGNSILNPTGGGGGLYCECSLILTDSTIRNNIADLSGHGGGLFGGDGTWLIRGSTVSGNSAEQGSGGGIYFDSNYADDPVFLMTNSTISDNSALLGGGLFLSQNEAEGLIAIRYSTIANNTATSLLGAGGAIFVDPAGNPVSSLSRSIIAGNAGTPTCYPTSDVASAGFNLLQDDACGNKATDQVGVNPFLGPLADNGGETETHALQPKSPAIDAGLCLPTVDVDQRGVTRPKGADCDIGAYEYAGGIFDNRLFMPILLKP